MKSRTPWVVAAAAVVFFATLTVSASPVQAEREPQFKIIELPNDCGGRASGINNLGVIVGDRQFQCDGETVPRVTAWLLGIPVNLGRPEEVFSIGSAISDRNQVIAVREVQSFFGQGILIDRGGRVNLTIGGPNAPSSPSGVNKHGQVAGTGNIEESFVSAIHAFFHTNARPWTWGRWVESTPLATASMIGAK
jgi:hypothetical protein